MLVNYLLGGYFTLTRSRLGTSATTARVAKIQARPPLTTENSGENMPATRPDSNWPSVGPPITNMALTELMRPRSSSGVVSWMIRPRRTMLTISAAPAPARKITPSHRGVGDSPNAMMHRPQPIIAITTPSP